uniref:Uncharacterized protein n=1 Tax=Oryza brachyantha TaxID=4533 RepID=J3LXN5_ORYBR
IDEIIRATTRKASPNLKLIYFLCGDSDFVCYINIRSESVQVYNDPANNKSDSNHELRIQI